MIVELGNVPRQRVLALAAALDDEDRGVALLDGRGWEGTFLAIDPIEEIRIDHEDSFVRTAAFLDHAAAWDAERPRGWGGLRPAPRWMGYIAYECARSIERAAWTRGQGVDDRPPPIGRAAVFRRFGAVARWAPQTSRVAIEGEDERAVGRLRRELERTVALPAPSTLFLTPSDDDDAHLRRIRRALELIGEGDLYQVNLARRFEGATEARATSVLAGLLQQTDARYGAALDFGDHALASSSPERFLDVQKGTGHLKRVSVRTTPIKGTRPRGIDAEDDARLALALAADPKERAELTMIVDLERNDLGRVAELGSVRSAREARLQTSRTVHHRVHDVFATLRTGEGPGDLLRATFPSGSVTGAPKTRAMEVIAELEASRRGAYCGTIVGFSPGGDLRASMTIRTVVLDRARAVAHYHAGGGIVADSDLAREVDETRWKARQVVQSFSNRAERSSAKRE